MRPGEDSMPNVDETWEDQRARARAHWQAERATHAAEVEARRAAGVALRAREPLPIIPLFQELRTLALSGPTPPQRMPYWRFVLARDLAVQLQPKDSTRRLFEGIALAGERITKDSFLRHDRSLARLKFWIEPTPDGGWLFHPRSIGLGPARRSMEAFLAWRGRVRAVLDPSVFATVESLTLITHACLCCGKALTDPLSQARKIGPECAQKAEIRAWLMKRWGYVVSAANT